MTAYHGQEEPHRLKWAYLARLASLSELGSLAGLFGTRRSGLGVFSSYIFIINFFFHVRGGGAAPAELNSMPVGPRRNLIVIRIEWNECSLSQVLSS